MLKKVLPAINYSLQPIVNWFYCAPFVRFSSSVNRYSDLSEQRIIKALIKAKGEIGRLNISRLKNSMKEVADRIIKCKAKAKELENIIADTCSLQIIIRNNSSYTAFITSYNENEIDVFLEYGVKGKIIADDEISKIDARHFIFNSAAYFLGQYIQVKPLDMSMSVDNLLF